MIISELSSQEQANGLVQQVGTLKPQELHKTLSVHNHQDENIGWSCIM